MSAVLFHSINYADTRGNTSSHECYTFIEFVKKATNFVLHCSNIETANDFFLCAHQQLIEIVGRTPAIIEISAFYFLFEKLVNEFDSGFALAGQLAT